MKALEIGLNELRRVLRRRSNIFFLFVFPMLLILVLGATFGNSSTPRLGVMVGSHGQLANSLLRQLEGTPGLRVAVVGSDAALLTGVERGNFDAGLEIPAGYDAAITSDRTASVRYLARPGLAVQRVGEAVNGAVARQVTLLGAFGLVAAGFGIFVGTLFRNEQQATGISLLLGLGLAALGGCMVPLEVFSPTLRAVAHVTPHAWANDAFAKLIGDGASIGGILPQLWVLAC